MPKVFYTERDVEDLYHRGVATIVVGDDVVMTDLARERARKLGMELTHEEKPPSAPQRPYIAKPITPSKPKPAPVAVKPSPIRMELPAKKESLYDRVYNACKAKLGDTAVTISCSRS